jgi:predicted RecB family nuclease
VFYRDELIALVEVDGESHYKQLSQQLRRKDKLKEFLYKQRYSVPLYRMRMDQIAAISASGAGKALASWIVKDLQLKNKSNQALPLPENKYPVSTKKSWNRKSV